MANIITTKKSGDYKGFYGPLDKGSAKPSFCYPRMKESLKEEIASRQRALDNGFVEKSKEIAAKMELRERERRLDAINAQEHEAKKLFNEDKDAWMKRREELKEQITQAMPSATDIAKKRANPYRIMELEKKKGLGEAKKEFQILSHLADEDSNTAILQRD